MVNILSKKNTAGIFVLILLAVGTFTLSGIPISNLVRGQTNTNSNNTSEIQEPTLEVEQQEQQVDESKEVQTQEQQQRPNHPPRANAGSDKNVKEGANMILDARRSSDPDGDQVSYLWRQTSGPRVTIENASATVGSFVGPDVNRDTSLSFLLTVRDYEGAQDTDTVKVSIENIETQTAKADTNNGNNNNNNIRSGQTNTNTNTNNNQEAETTTTNGLDNTTTTALLNAQSALRNNGSRITPPTTINPNNNQFSASTVFTPQAVLPLARVSPTQNIVNTKAFYDIIFRTGSSGAIKTIELVFPSGYSVACCLPFLNEVAGVGAGVASTSGSQTLIYTVSAADPPIIPASTTIRLEFANILNPSAPNNALAVSITTKDKNGGTIDGPTDSAAFPIKQIGTGDIANNAITGAKILDSTITSADIAPGTFSGGVADNSVTTAKIVDGEVMTADIADNAITSTKIGNGQVNSGDIAANSITSIKIPDGQVGTVDLADESVTADKIAGVTKLIFQSCDGSPPPLIPNQIIAVQCSVPGASLQDNVLITSTPVCQQDANQNPLLPCLEMLGGRVSNADVVSIYILNNTPFNVNTGPMKFSIMVFKP